MIASRNVFPRRCREHESQPITAGLRRILLLSSNLIVARFRTEGYSGAQERRSLFSPASVSPLPLIIARAGARITREERREREHMAREG